MVWDWRVRDEVLVLISGLEIVLDCDRRGGEGYKRQTGRGHHHQHRTMAAQAGKMEGESILTPAPEDGISSVTFAPTTDSLLAGCWDSQLRLYDASTSTLVHAFAHEAPVLDGCFTDNTHGIGVGLDCKVKLHDFARPAQSTVLGRHDAGIRCVEHSRDTGAVFSGGWDKVVNGWDPRAPGAAVATMQLPGKCFSMSLGPANRLLVATSERRLLCFDTRNLAPYVS